ncbi:hypothetical protein BDA99DRAFT_474765 [Phascolomyces articulosus]|uniref:G-patch domain-containing protein n=1 Tax=Phascolomyces articulosus TaxID=60185 RepID=A0AAD5KB39_9FUNG|nr:hypothetical protein BDA99DRAFT_474765 [Phascolomyces articulosus]
MSRYGDNESSLTEPKMGSDNHIVFGTAFPEQTERDRRQGLTDSGQFVPTWKQEVRDEKGRRRFHGAFTGGFSAGYYNTVGSKEGWTPSSFVSSRSARSEQRESRPEDFMDDEDLQEIANARKLVATDEFDVLGGTEREMTARKQQQKEDEARGSGVGFLGTSLMDMVGPTKDSVGIRLLRKLGWKPGQGIGPRCRAVEVDYVEIAGEEVTFAPRDTPIVDFKAKTDAFGLGYELEKHVPQVAEMRRLRQLQQGEDDEEERAAFGMESNNGRFGLGAFEEEDDDIDVYGDSRREYHHTLYDIEERPKKTHKPSSLTTTSRDVRKAPCSDGRPPLRGFSISEQPQELGKWYRPPQVPDDFNEQRNAQHPTTATAEPRYHMSSEERGAILGEKPIEPRSVFDYIPDKSKDRLDSVLKFMVDTGPTDSTKLTDFPTISRQQANMALRGYMPFGDNLKKQSRYRQYLENQAGLLSEDGEPKTTIPVPEGLTHEQGMKEMDEFAKAARIFRPISAMMSGRFTSASATKTTVEQTSFEGGLKTEAQWRKEKEIRDKVEAEKSKPVEKKSQEAEAASMKMFGQLTRTVKPFYPTRLVCKRFNVRNPHPNHDPSKIVAEGRTQAGSREALSEEKMDEMLRQQNKPKAIDFWKNDPALNAVIPKPSERPKPSVPESASPTPPPQKSLEQPKLEKSKTNETLDYERPSMDIFKAIFENSDEEDEEEDEQPQEPVNAESQGQPIVHSSLIKEKAQVDEDQLVGPPLPPQMVSSNVKGSTTTRSRESVTTTEPFRPKFSRPAERSSDSFKIASERVVVEPFKPRIHSSKRRHVSVSDDEDKEEDKRGQDRSGYKSDDKSDSDEDDEKSRRRRKKDKHKKRHKKSHRKEKRKKEKTSSSSSRKRKHSRYDSDGGEDDGAVWVEKEPVVKSSSSTNASYNDSKRTKTGGSSRPRASDLW